MHIVFWFPVGVCFVHVYGSGSLAVQYMVDRSKNKTQQQMGTGSVLLQCPLLRGGEQLITNPYME